MQSDEYTLREVAQHRCEVVSRTAFQSGFVRQTSVLPGLASVRLPVSTTAVGASRIRLLIIFQQTTSIGSDLIDYGKSKRVRNINLSAVAIFYSA